MGGQSFSAVGRALKQKTHSIRILTSRPFMRSAAGREAVFFFTFYGGLHSEKTIQCKSTLSGMMIHPLVYLVTGHASFPQINSD